MWLFYALIAPLFFAIVHILDSHCVGNIFEKPWFGVVTSSLASLIVIILIPFVYSELNFLEVSGADLLLAFICGCLIQISQMFYFQSLSHSEAGIVAAYWNLIPALLPLGSYLFLGIVLGFNQYIGITILIFASVLMCLADSNLHMRWRSFYLMLCASILQVAAYILEGIILDRNPFFVIFFVITAGIIITGLIPIFFKQARKSLVKNRKILLSVFWLLVIIESSNLIALGLAQKSISLGEPSLVAATETTLPAYTFILSLIFLFTYPLLGDKKVLHKIGMKFVLIALMVIGVLLISQ